MPRRTPTTNLAAGLSSRLEGASTRLRKTFKYDDDDDDNSDNSLPEVMDEQEQDSLIHNLSHQNNLSNTLTLRLLFLLPLLSSLPYLIMFLSPSSSSSSRLFPLLALSSLCSTLYLLYTLPTTSTGFFFLDITPTVGGMRVKSPTVKSPLEEYLPWLNLLLVVLVVLMGLVQEKVGKGGGGPHPVLLGGLPGIVYGVCIGVKKAMAGVDVEGELEGLRYGYKGA
ncbi:hypothetical protein QBC36DRAFT_371872 [Triangularia setosa]|uniref:Uncharacterized protein n=1 Tax=Triangularia setosa TaxID=2587417 RepID=A0AAN6VVM9_9PEZI|nr:hypothetical protein QBC36DRAFT_371872 [Podospora setosa]